MPVSCTQTEVRLYKPRKSYTALVYWRENREGTWSSTVTDCSGGKYLNPAGSVMKRQIYPNNSKVNLGKLVGRQKCLPIGTSSQGMQGENRQLQNICMCQEQAVNITSQLWSWWTSCGCWTLWVLPGQSGAVTPSVVVQHGPSDATWAQAASLFPAKVWVGTPEGKRDQQETRKHIGLISSSELAFSN